MIPSERQFDDGGGGPSTPATPLAPTALASQESGAIGAASMGGGSFGGASKAPKGPKPIDKSNWSKTTKVSQSQVDAVKDMGRGNMGKKAAYDMNVTRQRLGGLKSSPGASDIAPRKANASEREAVKRVYPKAYANATPGNSVPKSSRPSLGGSSPAANKPSSGGSSKPSWRTQGLMPGALGGSGDQSWRTEGLFPGALGGKKK